MSTSDEPTITLYTTQTPNGIKVSITLEELGLPYKVHKIDLKQNTQKEPWFLAINPNGRIPALTDVFTDGSPISLFESGAIMQYLVSRYDTSHAISYPSNTREAHETNCWLFFQNAGVGPMQGQANHFVRYAPEHIEYGVQRYTNETRRLYGVLNTHLEQAGRPYLVGDKCTIADIAHWGWVAAAGWAGVEIEEFPKLKEWEERMAQRPGIERGRHVPERHGIKELLKDKEKMERHAAESREWVQKGMREDREKLERERQKEKEK